ncbi:MAG: SDR family oxidoreductase [Deltaproteobacteria bacterium]|nr:SDR family oxidoreductase [Deltaproteobacteria bacterium]
MASSGSRRVLVTGASGYIGRQLVADLAGRRGAVESIVATDVREPRPDERRPGVEYVACDVRDQGLEKILRDRAVDTVVHLAAIVTPKPGSDADLEYSVDVLGTENVLKCAVAAGATKFLYTSSGAAYGYWPDNPAALTEDCPLRGNDNIAYPRNKRLVEEMLARARREQPQLRQLVLRPGTILGASVANQITAMFERPFVLGVAGSATPFVFIWDQDVVACLRIGIDEDREGIYNMAGDGVVTMREIATRLGKPYVELPAWLLSGALAVLHPLRLAQYGPEQVNFLRYRPVLSNEKLKREFGYAPKKTSAEVFEFYMQTHRA